MSTQQARLSRKLRFLRETYPAHDAAVLEQTLRACQCNLVKTVEVLDGDSPQPVERDTTSSPDFRAQFCGVLEELCATAHDRSRAVVDSSAVVAHDTERATRNATTLSIDEFLSPTIRLDGPNTQRSPHIPTKSRTSTTHCPKLLNTNGLQPRPQLQPRLVSCDISPVVPHSPFFPVPVESTTDTAQVPPTLPSENTSHDQHHPPALFEFEEVLEPPPEPAVPSVSSFVPIDSPTTHTPELRAIPPPPIPSLSVFVPPPDPNISAPRPEPTRDFAKVCERLKREHLKDKQARSVKRCYRQGVESVGHTRLNGEQTPSVTLADAQNNDPDPSCAEGVDVPLPTTTDVVVLEPEVRSRSSLDEDRPSTGLIFNCYIKDENTLSIRFAVPETLLFERTWIGLYDRFETNNRRYLRSIFTRGKKASTYAFDGLKRGKYVVRLFLNKCNASQFECSAEQYVTIGRELQVKATLVKRDGRELVEVGVDDATRPYWVGVFKVASSVASNHDYLAASPVVSGPSVLVDVSHLKRGLYECRCFPKHSADGLVFKTYHSCGETQLII